MWGLGAAITILIIETTLFVIRAGHLHQRIETEPSMKERKLLSPEFRRQLLSRPVPLHDEVPGDEDDDREDKKTK